MKAKLNDILNEQFKFNTNITFTICEEHNKQKLMKYITEFDEDQVPYFLVRVKEGKIKTIYVYNKQLNIVASIS